MAIMFSHSNSPPCTTDGGSSYKIYTAQMQKWLKKIRVFKFFN